MNGFRHVTGSLASFEGMTNLQSMSVPRVKLVTGSISSLKNLTQLVYLRLDGVKLVGGSLLSFEGLVQLDTYLCTKRKLREAFRRLISCTS